VKKRLGEGAADDFALCRPLICESGLVHRWRHGGTAPVK